MKCENCGCEHDGSYETGKFCSKTCKHQAIARRGWETKHKLGIHINNLRPDLLRAEYGRWKCTICGEICESRRIMQKHRREKHSDVYLIPWNKGLTAQTSEKIKNALIKSSQTLRRLNLHNKHTIASRERISHTMSLKMQERGGFPDVKWYEVQNNLGIVYTVRGTWERDVATWLNNHHLTWERNHILYYRLDGVRHFYNPDFFLVESGMYIEVKGYFSLHDQIKMFHVLEDNPKIKLYFINKPIFEKLNEESFCLSDEFLLTKDYLFTNNKRLEEIVMKDQQQNFMAQ